MQTVHEPVRTRPAPRDATNRPEPHDDVIQALLERCKELASAHQKPTSKIGLAVGPSLERVGPATWAPRSSARLRVVEAIALAALCAYFGIGLALGLAGL